MQKKYQVYFVLLFSILVSAYLLYDTLWQTTYIPSSAGDYIKVVGDAQAPATYLEAEAGKGDYQKVRYLDLLGTIDWNWNFLFGIVLACCCMVGRDLGYILRIRNLTERKLSFRGAYRAIMVWEFSSAVSPGVVGGAGVAMFILNKEGISLGRSTAIVFVTALLDNLFYLLVVPVLLFLLPHGDVYPAIFERTIYGVHFSIREFFWLGYGIIFLISVIIFLSLTFFPNLLKSIFNWLLRPRFLASWHAKAMKMTEEMQLASKDIHAFSWGLWARAFCLTSLAWISRFLVINALMFGALPHLGWMDQTTIFASQLVFWVILLITPTPGGTGIAELAFSGFFKHFFPTQFLSVILAFIWRLVSYYPYLFIGAFILPKWLTTQYKSAEESSTLAR